MGSLGPGSVGGGGHSSGKKYGHLSTAPEGLSLAHVLQQQVHSLRKVVHVPVSLHFRMMLIGRPGRQDCSLVWRRTVHVCYYCVLEPR